MNNKGFTLVEVLSVIAIIAIVGTITVPSVLSMMNSSKKSNYDIMIKNIRTAAEDMYQEIDYFGSQKIEGDYLFIDDIKQYNAICSNEGYDECNTGASVQIDSAGEMKINLQTLVSNGFLSGASNDGLNDPLVKNKNKKILKEPFNDEDIGFCEIIVTKKKIGNSKVCYKIESYVSEDGQFDDKCPSDYGNVRGCS